MAKFTSQNVEFKDGQKAIFGTDDDSSIYWNSNNDELVITTVTHGVDPTAEGHLVTKRYVDNITMYSGTGVNSFIALTDTPSSYLNKAGYMVTVNQSANALEFTPPGAYNMDGGFASSIYGGNVDGGFSSSVYGGISSMEGGHA
jgi:hypothetical protein